MDKCECKGRTFEEVKSRILCFEDHESGQEAVPAPEEALAEIRAGKCLPDLFSNVKAFLMSAVTELDIVDDLVSGGSDRALSAQMGVALRELIEQVDDRVTVLENEMNTVQGDVADVKNELSSVQTDISDMKNSIVNDLVTGGIDVPLSAEMGKELNEGMKAEALARQEGDRNLEGRITDLTAELSDLKQHYVQSGSGEIKRSTVAPEGWHMVHVTFPRPFSSRPNVVASHYLTNISHIAITVMSATTTGATFGVYSGGTAYPYPVCFNWIATGPM